MRPIQLSLCYFIAFYVNAQTSPTTFCTVSLGQSCGGDDVPCCISLTVIADCGGNGEWYYATCNACMLDEGGDTYSCY